MWGSIREFILQTDASDWGLGAVLGQDDEDGMEYPVCTSAKSSCQREEKSIMPLKRNVVKLGV